jgi:hypothetical protein
LNIRKDVSPDEIESDDESVASEDDSLAEIVAAPQKKLDPATSISTAVSNQEANRPSACVGACGPDFSVGFTAITSNRSFSSVVEKNKGNNDDGETSDDDWE